MGRYLAISEAWGARHSLRWNNMRFYFNPVTALLEPVAFDAMVGYALSAREMYEGRYPFVSAALRDSSVRAHYEATLHRWSTRDNEVVARLEGNQERYRSTLRRSYPLLRAIDLNVVAQRAADLLSLNADGPLWIVEQPILHSYAVQDNGRHYLELASMVPESLEVTSIYWRWDGESPPARSAATEGLSLPLVLDGTPVGQVPRPLRVPYLPLEGHAALWMDVRPFGTSRGVQAVPAREYFPAVARSPLAPHRLDEVMARYRFLRWEPDSLTVSVPAGTWQITEPLVLPEGVRLVVRGGATLHLEPDAAIVVRAPLHLRGEPGRPVRLRGTVRRGESGPWPGIVVMGADEASEWSHVEVVGTAGIDLDGWKLTSGVTFYESDVHISDATFLRNRTEDVLNIVRSSFTLSDVDFADAVSDGLDADFSDGAITGGSFDTIGWVGGGDAIDVSGADVTAEAVRFAEIGDKAISVGEGGSVVVRNVTISNATAGVVSKDASRVEVTSSKFEGIELAALMVYIKKPEYGPASLIADHVEFEKVARRAWVQTESTIHVNGHPVPTVAVNVDSLYDTAMRKRRPAR